MGQEDLDGFPVGSTRGRCKRMRRTIRLLVSLGTAVLLACAVVTAAVVGSARSMATAAERPNIVFIMTDDMPGRLWSTMPTLRDRVGAQGVRFTNAYVT